MKNLLNLLLSCVLYLLIGISSQNLRAADDQIMLENLRIENAAVPEIFQTMQAKTGVEFELKGSSEFVNTLPRFKMQFDRIPVTAVIQLLCYDAGLDYSISGKKITFEKSKPVAASGGKKAPSPGGTRMTVGHTSAYPVGWTTPRMVVQNGSVTTIGPVPRFRKVTSGIDVSTSDENSAPTAKKAIKPSFGKTSFPDDPVMVQELKSIPINNVRLQDVPLDATIDELRSLGRNRSSGQYVNIYMSLRISSKAKLTMTLDKQNLYDSLSYVCKAANVKMLILSWGVVITEE